MNLKAGVGRGTFNLYRDFPLFSFLIFIMKKLTLVAAVCALLSGAAFAQAEGPWMVRARAVNIDSVNKDTTGLGLTINDKVIPEVDITYFLSKNLAAELILTVPQKHTLSSKGTEIGKLSHLPPTLTLQYHFDTTGFKPYVGAGVNYTRFSSVNILNGGADIKRNSLGLALQAGVDIPVAKNVYLNFDVKKVYIGTDVSAGGVAAGSFKVNPLLVGVGVGYRF